LVNGGTAGAIEIPIISEHLSAVMRNMKPILIADDKANIRNLFRRVTVMLEQIMVDFVRTSKG
jgi:hypothetical protein